MKTLYLIRGVPGSGKSSFAAILLANQVVDDFVEADQYFVNEGVYCFNPYKLKEAHEWCQNHTRVTLGRGYSIAVSNTSTTEKEVETYRKIAEECNAKFISIVVENRHGGKNIHGVPEEKLQQMKDRFSTKL
jgi:predicted ABC-type ATPase